MNFRFRQKPQTRYIDPVTLILQTEDPLLFRAGGTEDYPDVDTVELNRLLLEAKETEFRKVHRVLEKIGTEECKAAMERSIENLRVEARELFTAMDECRNDRERLIRLNDSFNALTDLKRRTEMAFSQTNPWLAYYRKIERMDEKTMTERVLGGIIVHATILDKDWFDHPAYPEGKPFYKDLKDAWTGLERNKTPKDRQMEKKGWVRMMERNRPADRKPYVEPALKILSYEPIIHFSGYRDLLPPEWLDWDSQDG